MSASALDPAIDLATAYSDASWSTRLHVRGRLATAPLGRLEALVPPSGVTLDLGCGLGLLSLLLASGSPHREVFGTDIDADRVVAARAAAARLGLGDRVRFDTVPATWTPAPSTADAVVICDVLYLLPPTRARALVMASARSLRPGGVLIVKEMADAPRWRRAVTSAQEQVSVRLTRMTRSSGAVMLHPESSIATAMSDAGLTVERVPLSEGYLHPHVAHVGTSRPHGGPDAP